MGAQFRHKSTHKSTHKSILWLSCASWAWEILRRNPDYITYYAALKNKAVETTFLSDGSVSLKGLHNYPTATKFGLLAPADPSKYAGDTAILWSPKAFHSVVRFHVIDPSSISKASHFVQLSKLAGQKTHFIDASGTYHIRVLGERFWFQMQCADTQYVAPDAYIGFEINDLENPDKRLETIKEIGGIYDGSIAIDARLHVPARLENHQKFTLAYDIRTAGGTVSDVILAFIEVGLLIEDPRKYVDFNNAARYAFRAAKAYVYGDYLKILNRQ